MKNRYPGFVAIVQCLSLFSSQMSWALQPPSNLKNAKAAVVCEDFCKQFVPAEFDSTNPEKKVGAGLFSSNTWSIEDDQFCAQLGQATTTSFGPLPDPHPSFVGETACNNVAITTELFNKLNASTKSRSQVCVEAGKHRDHCYYHNSQVENQCLAYAAIVGLQNDGKADSSNALVKPMESNAMTLDKGLLIADYGAAALCMAGCTTGNPVALTACAAASVAAGTTEIVATIKQNSSTVSQVIASQSKMSGMDYVSGIGGGLGAMAGVGIGSQQLHNLWTGSGTAGAPAANGAAANGAPIANGAPDPNGSGNGAPAQSAQDAQRQRQSRLACGSAAIFAVLAGVRTNSLIQMQKSGDEACKSINELFSASSAPGGGPSPNVPGYGSNGATGAGSSDDDSSATGAGGSTGIGATSSSQLSDWVNCLQKTQCFGTEPKPVECTNAYCQAQAKITGQTTASTDGNLLAPNAAPGALFKPIGNVDDFIKKATTEGAGPAMAGIMPSSAGNMGTALANIAATAQKEAPSLAGPLHIGSTYASSGSPSKSKGQDGGSADNSLSSLFANSGGGGMMGGSPSLANFGDTLAPEDIFHTGSKRTLFQIISEKTWSVSNRVESLTPRPFDPRE